MDTFCQSCGMPMGDQTDLYGTEKNGEKNAEFCKYCYENGEYTFHVADAAKHIAERVWNDGNR